MNSCMWRVYLQNSRDVGSTLARARVVKTGSGLISSAGAANIADGFLKPSPGLGCRSATLSLITSS